MANVVEALVLGFKTKALRIYGRSSRSEFWYFYLASLLLLGGIMQLHQVPIVGSLIQAVLFILVMVCQFTAMLRRLHDCNKSGKIVALPYALGLFYFLALFPLHGLYPELATKLLGTIAGIALVSYLLILYFCMQPGTSGNNNYGTDPLDPNTVAQDFINPQHLQNKEYLGDPWRSFKNKVAKEKEAAAHPEQNSQAKVAVATPQASPEKKAKQVKHRKK